ncbi:Thromboxane-A synthase [Halotydeus destructor]|nr:Thromboxane-A synthase [Halotydeus destructor]
MTILQRGNIPGPPPHFILGNSAEFAAKGMKRCFQEWSDKYGPVVGFYLGGHPNVVVCDLELLRKVEIRDFHLFSNRHQLIKGGPHPTTVGQQMHIWMTGDHWKRSRLATSKIFTSANLKTFADTVKRNVQVISALFEKESNGLTDEFDIEPCFRKMTFYNMAETQLSIKVDLEKHQELKIALDSASSPRLEGIFAAPLLLFPELEIILSPLRKLWEEVREYFLWSPQSIIIKLARDALQRRKKTSIVFNDMLGFMMRLTKDSKIENEKLEMAIEEKVESKVLEPTGTGSEYTDTEIVANLFLNLLAGYETTASALSYITHCLTHHPELQEDIRVEVKQLLDQDGVLNYNAVNELPLLESFMKESLRMFPPLAPFVNRTADVDYEYNGMTIPAGAGVYVGVNQIQYDETCWPEPMTFNPERFSGQRKVEAIAYQPFGAGPRNCVGMRFAVLQIKLAMAEFLLKYKFERGPTSEGFQLEQNEEFAISAPKYGVKVKLVRVAKL